MMVEWNISSMAVDPAGAADPAKLIEERYYRSDPIAITVEPTGGGDKVRGELLLWTCATGMAYVSWRIGSESGRLGVWDQSRNVVWFGPHGVPETEGRYRYVLELGPAAEPVEYAYWHALSVNQSPSAMARSISAAHTGPAETVAVSMQPAPQNSAAVGAVHAFELEEWESSVEARFQAWRPLNCGAVYVACDVDRTMLEWSCLQGTTVWFGRTSGWNVFAAYPAGEETFAALAGDIEAIRSDVPDAGYRVVSTEASTGE